MHHHRAHCTLVPWFPAGELTNSGDNESSTCMTMRAIQRNDDSMGQQSGTEVAYSVACRWVLTYPTNFRLHVVKKCSRGVCLMQVQNLV
jgi:hypothetical protein